MDFKTITDHRKGMLGITVVHSCESQSSPVPVKEELSWCASETVCCECNGLVPLLPLWAFL